jgi:hypothetical protein
VGTAPMHQPLLRQTASQHPTHTHVQDVEEARGKISDSLLQRLILKPQKIAQLAEGIRAIAAQEEPIRRVLSRTAVADSEQGQRTWGQQGGGQPGGTTTAAGVSGSAGWKGGGTCSWCGSSWLVLQSCSLVGAV